MRRKEDQHRTLIFADVLGFEALVDKYKVRVKHLRRSKKNHLSLSSTTPIQSVFYKFDVSIDIVLQEEGLNGGLQAMVFSDCAYFVAANPIHGVHVATALMRQFLELGVPVRMGIGQGTFYDFGYSTDTSGGPVVSKSRFLGTGCLRAYAAEQCGGKGMRIFVDSSLRDAITLPQQSNRVLPLPRPLKTVNWELNYLYDDRLPSKNEPSADEADRKLFDNVAALRDLKARPKVQRHHIDTLNAMNRMRQRFSRERVILRKLRYGSAIDGWM